MPEPTASNGFNLLVDPHPSDIDTIPYTVMDDLAGPSQAETDGGGFYTGLTPYVPDPNAQRLFRRGLNGNGYLPRPGDANLLARLIYAEGSNTPQDMDALGWAAVNRVGDREFGQTLDQVLHRRNAFESIQTNGHQWLGSANPQRLTGPSMFTCRRRARNNPAYGSSVFPRLA